MPKLYGRDADEIANEYVKKLSTFFEKHPKTAYKILSRLNDAYPTKRLKSKEKEYKGDVFLLSIPEGGNLGTLSGDDFSPWASTGDIDSTGTVRFFAKVIGFEDLRAPVRDWGMDLETYKKFKLKR